MESIEKNLLNMMDDLDDDDNEADKNATKKRRPASEELAPAQSVTVMPAMIGFNMMNQHSPQNQEETNSTG